MSVKSISVALSASMGNYATTFKQAGQATKEFSGELGTLSQTSKSKFNDVTNAAGGLGLGLTAGFGAAVTAAAKFDKQMSELGAVSGANAAQMDKLRTAAINAGQATVFSANEAAEAETELSKAGLSTSDILGGALTGSLALASAGTLDLADAATDTATALNIFQLGGFSASHVADLLSAGANQSATDVAGLANSMNQAGLVAHQTGLSIEDTTGVLALFAQNGLKGSDAGTSFKTMLQALQSPSGITKGLMDQLGISAYDASGKFIGITAVAQQLQNQLKDLTAAQRDAALAQIFGTDAVRSADILYQQGASGVGDWITKVNQTGAAADTAAKKMDNLSGDVENLKGSIETMTIASGEGLQSGLRSITEAATREVNSLAVMPPAVSKVGTSIVGLAGFAILGGTALAKMSAKSTELQDTLTKMGPTGAKAASGLSLITSAGTKLTLTLGALQAVSATMGTTISPSTAQTVKDLQNLGATGNKTGDELKDLDYDLGTISSSGGAKFGNSVAGVTESLTGLGNVLDKSMVHAKERLADIDSGLAAMVSSGHMTDALEAFNQIQAAADKQGVSMDDLNAALPNYVAAMDSYSQSQLQSADAISGSTSATDDLSTSQANLVATGASATAQMVKVDQSIQDTIGDAKGLSDLFDSLNGVSLTLAKAQDNLQASFDAADKAVQGTNKNLIKHKEALNDGSAAGRANLGVLYDIIDATEKDAQATLNQTGSAKKANDVMVEGRNKFIAVAEALGDSATQAQALADKLFALPPVTSPKVTTPGLTGAYTSVEKLNRLLDRDDGRTVNMTVLEHFQTEGTPPSSYYHGNRWGGAYAHNARGGVYQHAADGLLNQASYYSATNPGRYMIAEPQTGGEAFVPRFGDYHRSMGILNQAAGWYGAMVAPRGSGGGGASSLELRISADAGATPMVNQLRFEISQLGGDPVRVLTPR